MYDIRFKIDGFEFEYIGSGHSGTFGYNPEKNSLKSRAFRRAIIKAEKSIPGIRAQLELDEYASHEFSMYQEPDGYKLLRALDGLDYDLIYSLLDTIDEYGMETTQRTDHMMTLIALHKNFGDDGILKRFPPIEKTKGSNKRNRPGFVYVLHSDRGDYKIGRTSKPKERGKAFGVMLPFHVEYDLLIKADNYTEFELELHEYFKEKRTAGEWFKLTDGDLEYLRVTYAERLVSVEEMRP